MARKKKKAASSNGEREMEEEAKLTALLSWMRSNGFEVHPRLSVSQIDGVRGVVTSERIEKDEDVFRVPEKVMLRTDSVLGVLSTDANVGSSSITSSSDSVPSTTTSACYASTIVDVMEVFRKEVGENLTLLALALLYEKYVMKKNSFWAPWIGNQIIFSFSLLVRSSHPITTTTSNATKDAVKHDLLFSSRDVRTERISSSL